MTNLADLTTMVRANPDKAEQYIDELLDSLTPEQLAILANRRRALNAGRVSPPRVTGTSSSPSTGGSYPST